MPALLSEGQAGQRGYPPDITGRGVPQKLLQLNTVRTQAGQVNGLRARQHTEMADVSGNGRGMDPQAPVQEVRVQAGIQETSFPLGGGPATRYQRQAELQAAVAIRDMFVFMCFSGLAHADLKELSYRNVHTDSDGNTWLVGNRVKTKAPYVVKLLPIAVELIEKYRGVNEFKVSPDRVFPVGEIGSMEDSLKRIGEKTGCSVRVSPHTAKHNSFVI